MTERHEASRNRLWNLVRIVITLGAIGFVYHRLQQEGWDDRLCLEDGRWIRGWYATAPDGSPRLRDHQGTLHLIPAESPDAKTANRFVPGFITLLKRTRLSYLGLALMLYPLVVFLSARRWQWLLQTHEVDPGFGEALRLTWIGNLANHVLLGATGGDFIKGWAIQRRTPGKRLAAVMTVLIDRVIGLISLLVVGGGAILTQSHRAELAWPAQFVAIVLVIVVGGSVIYFSGRMRRLLRFTEILERLPFRHHLQKLDASVFHFRGHLGCLLKCLAISLLIHGWTIVCVVLMGQALGLKVSWIYYFVFLPVIFTAGAVIPSVGGLGVLEGGFQQFFALPGVGTTPSGAVALCLLFRLMQLVSSLPGVIPTYQELWAHGGNVLGQNAAAAPAETPREDSACGLQHGLVSNSDRRP